MPLNYGRNGGVIGPTIPINANEASGIWSLNEIYKSTTIASVPISFYESRYGTDIGTIDVYIVDVSGNIQGDSIYSASGDRGTPDWFDIDLGELEVPDTFRVAWHYVNGGSFRGDYAIDQVVIGDNTYSFESDSESFLTTSGTDTGDSVTALSGAITVPTSTGATPSQWNRDSGGTGSSSTGPDSGFDGNFYLYTETTSPNNSTGVNFWLFSPEIER